MKNVFLVLGYGIPKDILKAENYNFYLKLVFNKIYDVSAKDSAARPIVIFCGGNTDIFRPHKRNEADEMIKLFSVIIKQRPFLNQLTKRWRLIPEKKSLSSLENLIYGKTVIQQHKIKKTNLFIFCEQTREQRIKLLAKKIFDKNYNIRVVPIDFDVSVNRYLSPDFLSKKEAAELKHSLWALKNAKNFKKHHEVFKEKIDYLRKAGPKAHTDALKKWWARKLKELK